MSESHLTLHEVADELGVHYMTVYRYVRLGYLPAHKEGGSWRVERKDLDDFVAEPEAVRGRGQSDTAWDQRLVQRLLAADQAGSWKVVEAAQASGMELRSVYMEMIIPAMRSVGEQWEQGSVSIAQEHAASQVMVRLVSRLSAQIARRGVSKGTIVVGTTATDLHTLPLMLAADLIRLEGFEVLDLGSNLPASSFAETAAVQQRLVAVGISVTAPDQANAIQETIAELRSQVDVPIFIGGSAIDGPEHAKLLGADFGGPGVNDVVPELLDLV
ncbi:MAG: B12-binding domain-containing protein [Acidimicrobiia bacterium]|nr:B12-binding domain-containing protein [Acidimicrobiia bacterium]